MNTDAPFLPQVWQHSGPLVVAPLVLLAAIFLWMTLNLVEHVARCGGMAWRSRTFLRSSLALLEQGNWQAALALAAKHPRSHLACVFSRALAEFCGARETVTFEEAVEIAGRSARVAANRIREQYREGVSGLKAIALTAPLVGLFGTSVRLLDWFGGYVGSKYYHVLLMFGIAAKALVPTLLGLFVGVVALWWFNWRIARVEKLDTQVRIASLELLKYLKLSLRCAQN